MRISDIAAHLLPPVVPMVLRKIRQRHPFDCLPQNTPVEWVLDIGANKGDVALAALKSYPSCKVICFEPVQATFDLLQQNLNAYSDRTFLYHSALAETAGVGEINITSFHGANSILPQSPFHKKFNPHIGEMRKEQISLVRLDDIAAQFPTTHIDIMKIDVEGYEINVLKGGRAFIQSCVDTIIVEASLMRDASWERQGFMDLFLELTQLGFRLINIFDVHKADDSEMMLVQMDCIWRHQRVLARN